MGEEEKLVIRNFFRQLANNPWVELAVRTEARSALIDWDRVREKANGQNANQTMPAEHSRAINPEHDA